MTSLTVNAVAGGLDRGRAEPIEAGPEHVAAAPGYPELMSRAEFSQVAIGDEPTDTTKP